MPINGWRRCFKKSVRVRVSEKHKAQVVRLEAQDGGDLRYPRNLAHYALAVFPLIPTLTLTLTLLQVVYALDPTHQSDVAKR